jgi:NAD(P)H-hydrate epimerase
MQQIASLPALPGRPRDAHKGTFGRVMIIAGSRGMSGASILAGVGALRGGAGLVYVAAPAGIVPAVAAYEPSYLTVPLPEDAEGRIAEAAANEILYSLDLVQAAAVGPGLGQSDELEQLVAGVYRTVDLPLVVDADALNVLSNAPARLADHAGPRILTPHPGEFSRLTGERVGSDPVERQQAAAAFAAENEVVLILKGAGTVITDGDRLAVNSTGNSGMATGGTGDVLTGLVASLLAQGMEPFAAAQLGVHVHGLAGDLIAAKRSGRGMIASDLLDGLCEAWIALEGN